MIDDAVRRQARRLLEALSINIVRKNIAKSLTGFLDTNVLAKFGK